MLIVTSLVLNFVQKEDSNPIFARQPVYILHAEAVLQSVHKTIFGIGHPKFLTQLLQRAFKG